MGPMRWILAVGLMAGLDAPARASLRPSLLFCDHMVLQRGVELPIWGTAEPGEAVTVSIAGKSETANAGADGRWMIRLEALQAGGPHEMTINTLVIKDVWVGEVWLCSGQSNMEWPLKEAANGKAEIAAAAYPKIRGFTVPKSSDAGRWQVCSPETAAGFSAVGYFFGREIHKTLDVPVGLIFSTWAGTPVEAWMSHESLKADPGTKASVEEWLKHVADYPRLRDEYEQARLSFEKEADRARDEKRAPSIPRPKAPLNPKYASPRWGSLYGGMIAPLIPYAIAGILWYQGESNTTHAGVYRERFSRMIVDWRRAWALGDLPFLFVQLPNFAPAKTDPPNRWALVREAQLQSLSIPKSGMAVAIDIGDPNDIHPRNKQEVGRRLALAALSIAYGKKLVFSGPVYESMKIEGDKIRLTFNHSGGGLVCKGEVLHGFALAGEDRIFVPAEAAIDGHSVVVSAPGVTKPAAVRYAWADSPEVSLYNKEGLPASPFRTDAWK